MSDHETWQEAPQLSRLFPTSILTCRLPDAGTLNRELLDYILDLEASNPEGRRRSNQLGWQSTNLDYAVPAVGRFCTLVLQRCQHYGHAMGWAMGDDLRLVIKECWANINRRYAYNQAHHHTNSLLSGVYYLKVLAGNCGPLVLLDPRRQALVLQPEYAQRHAENTPVQRIPPSEGHLIIFPSWLEHGVEQNLEDAERISMSFNVDLVPSALVHAARQA